MGAPGRKSHQWTRWSPEVPWCREGPLAARYAEGTKLAAAEVALRNEWVAVGVVDQGEGLLTAVKGKHDERRRRSLSGQGEAFARFVLAVGCLLHSWR